MTDKPDTAQRASDLLALHQSTDLLTVVNVWDVITARVVTGVEGTRALATASHSIAASRGYEDGENIPVDEMIAEVGRDPGEVAVTVLDLPVVGRDRDDVWERVERLRGRTTAATYARRHHAGTPDQHRERYAGLADRGVSTVFVALPDLARPEDLLDVASMLP